MNKRLLLIFFLLVLLALSCSLGLARGSVPLTPAQLRQAFLSGESDPAGVIVFRLRLPRVAGAGLAGAALAVAGLLLQSVTSNGLCSPGILGVNAGAGLAVMILLCLFPAAYALLPAASFLGAMAASFLVLGLAALLDANASRASVILPGVAVSTFFNAGISFLSQLYPEVLSAYSAFSVGGFSGLYRQELRVPALMILMGILLAWLLSGKLNLLCLGDEMAASLGVAVAPLRRFCLILSSALCAATVCFAGLLGFVGLMVPHMARRLAGHDLRILIPAAALLGATLVILSDLLARTLFSPSELPAGILMAAVGAPFFLVLLLQQRRRSF